MVAGSGSIGMGGIFFDLGRQVFFKCLFRLSARVNVLLQLGH